MLHNWYKVLCGHAGCAYYSIKVDPLRYPMMLHTQGHSLEEKLIGPLFPSCLPEVVSEVPEQLEGLWAQRSCSTGVPNSLQRIPQFLKDLSNPATECVIVQREDHKLRSEFFC